MQEIIFLHKILHLSKANISALASSDINMEGFLFLKKSIADTKSAEFGAKWSRRHCSIVFDPQRGSYLVARKRVEEGYLEHNKHIADAVPFASSVINLNNFAVSVMNCVGPDGAVSGGVLRLYDATGSSSGSIDPIELRDKSHETAMKWKAALTEAQNVQRTMTPQPQQAAPLSLSAADDKENTPRSNINILPRVSDAGKDISSTKMKKSVVFQGDAASPLSLSVTIPAHVPTQAQAHAPAILSLSSATITPASVAVDERVTEVVMPTPLRKQWAWESRTPLFVPMYSPVATHLEEPEKQETVSAGSMIVLHMLQMILLTVGFLVGVVFLLPPARGATLYLAPPMSTDLIVYSRANVDSSATVDLKCVFAAISPPATVTITPLAPAQNAAFASYELLHDISMLQDEKRPTVSILFPKIVSSFTAPVLVAASISSLDETLKIQVLKEKAELSLFAAESRQQELKVTLEKAEFEDWLQSLAQAEMEKNNTPEEVEIEAVEDTAVKSIEAVEVEEFKEAQKEKEKISLAARTGGTVLRVATGPFRALGWLVGKAVK